MFHMQRYLRIYFYDLFYIYIWDNIDSKSFLKIMQGEKEKLQD